MNSFRKKINKQISNNDLNLYRNIILFDKIIMQPLFLMKKKK